MRLVLKKLSEVSVCNSEFNFMSVCGKAGEGGCCVHSGACVGQVGRVLICLTANLQRSGPMDQTVQ